eukprot:PhF_6_TR8698/c0_g1_i1/m.13631
MSHSSKISSDDVWLNVISCLAFGEAMRMMSVSKSLRSILRETFQGLELLWQVGVFEVPATLPITWDVLMARVALRKEHLLLLKQSTRVSASRQREFEGKTFGILEVPFRDLMWYPPKPVSSVAALKVSVEPSYWDIMGLYGPGVGAAVSAETNPGNPHTIQLLPQETEEEMTDCPEFVLHFTQGYNDNIVLVLSDPQGLVDPTCPGKCFIIDVWEDDYPQVVELSTDDMITVLRSTDQDTTILSTLTYLFKGTARECINFILDAHSAE